GADEARRLKAGGVSMMTSVPVVIVCYPCSRSKKEGGVPPSFLRLSTLFGERECLTRHSNFACLGAFLPLCCLVLNLLAFVQRLVAVPLNPAEVDEQILAPVVRGDKAVALL